MNRLPFHAGSWYTEDEEVLDSELTGWLSDVPSTIENVGSIPPKGARIIIAPHAGYSYSGPAAAWAYKSLDLTNIKRVFILGPSHHAYLSNCALSLCAKNLTPLGELTVDQKMTEEIHAIGGFSRMSGKVDCEEHSIEMHLPYTYKMFSLAFGSDPSNHPSIVPILVGSITAEQERGYGGLLKPYLTDPQNAFIISSDFCHWGLRFRYTYYKSQSSPATTLTRSSRIKSDDTPIHESIEILDKEAIDAIESGKHDEFVNYLKKTGNTVCGRHPIGVIMAGLEEIREEDQKGDDWGRFKFVRYEQSSQCMDIKDSSVSYASAFAVL